VRTDEQNRSGPEISAFLDLNRLNRMRSSSMDNELGVLRSRRLLKNTIQALQLEVGYYKEGKMGHEVELYNQSPIMARSLGKQSLAVAKKTPMATQRAVINNSDAGFSIQLDGSDEVIAGAFGEPLQLPFGEYVFSLNEKDNVADFPVILSFEDLENLITKYESLLTIDLVDKNSSHVEIDLEYPNKKKAQDILDQMVLEYNTEARNDKALLVDITGNFIGQRLQELDNGFTDSIKENNGFKWLETMLAAEADLDLDNAHELNRKQQQYETQLGLIYDLQSYLEMENPGPIPAGLGLDDRALNVAIERYNLLAVEQEKLVSAQASAAVMNALDKNLGTEKNKVLKSLNDRQQVLTESLQNLQRERGTNGFQVSKAAKDTLDYDGTQAHNTVKEALFLYLLRKREENKLSKLVTATKARVVDKAYSSAEPISPNKKLIYAFAIIMGLAIPFFTIYLIEAFKTSKR